MRYITSIERMGIEKGLQRLLDALPADLERWADRLLEAQQLDEVFHE